MLVVVLVLEDSDHFAISLAEQNSCKTSVYLRNRAEDEHDDEDEDDLGSSNRNRPRTRPRPRLLDLRLRGRLDPSLTLLRTRHQRGAAGRSPVRVLHQSRDRRSNATHSKPVARRPDLKS